MFKKTKFVIVALSILFVSYGLAAGLLKMASANSDVYTGLSVFTSVLDRIQDDYVEVPDMDNVLKGAIQGMMEAVDPYSSFVDSRTYDEVMAANRDVGIGVSLAKRYGYMYVISTEKGSLARESGLRSGDLIETIDGNPTDTMSLWEAEKRLFGAESSSLEIRVIRTRRQEPLVLTIQRERAVKNDIAVRVLDGDLGLVSVPDFRAGAAQELAAGLKKLVSSNVKGLIIDLRGAFTGNLDEAVEAADLFMEEGQGIVSIRVKDREVEIITATAGTLVADIPLILLADAGTSGSAEVFVAALQDNDLADVVGVKTEGKGSVQKKLPLESGGFLYLSHELLVRPNGNPIQDRNFRMSGIEPDQLAPGRDFINDYYLENTPDNDDVQLGVDFFKNLDNAIDEEQMRMARKIVRDLINNPAAIKIEKKAA
ncbi:MAG: S41 family peptidase [Acidobacteriota bacterium]